MCLRTSNNRDELNWKTPETKLIGHVVCSSSTANNAVPSAFRCTRNCVLCVCMCVTFAECCNTQSGRCVAERRSLLSRYSWHYFYWIFSARLLAVFDTEQTSCDRSGLVRVSRRSGREGVDIPAFQPRWWQHKKIMVWMDKMRSVQIVRDSVCFEFRIPALSDSVRHFGQRRLYLVVEKRVKIGF